MTSPTPGAGRETPKRANFALSWEIFVAPARAFERIAVLPEWVLSYALVVALLVVAKLLEYPAVLHVTSVLDHGKPAALRPTSSDVLEFSLLDATLGALIGIMIPAIAYTIFAATRDFKKLATYPAILSLVTNAMLIYAAGEVLSAIGIRLHDPSSFTSQMQLDMAFPDRLTVFATNPAQADFLTHFSVFDTWSDIVVAFGLVRLAGVKLVPALVFVFTLDLVFAFIPA